ncbi:sensor histidine kinase [Cryptosporangium aurantiacum]|uniref:sensor histidine kinase n=1 Tax=Cryptosporangium aurantiacum TaxID=134849 RepID=UPI001160E811|nr:ATP-binding protein [Cryptosporangium aurantiacum]
MILLVAGVSLDHRPLPYLVNTFVALAGALIAGGLAIHAGPRTRVLYLSAALFGSAVALSGLPISEQLPLVGTVRAVYLPALVLVVVAAVLAWPEMRATLSQERDKIRTAAIENHRAYISRELHDETLQALIHLRRSLEHAAAGPDATVLRHAAKDGAELAAEQITALRDIIADLHPPLLTELGLAAALETLVDRTARRHPQLTLGFQVTADGPTDGTTPIDSATALSAYRIAQEALSNALKHSGATHITVTLVHQADGLTLRVSDNGTGIHHTDGVNASHEECGGIGIPAMHARAALHQGQLTISVGTASSDPCDLTGTTVSAALRASAEDRP